MRTPQDCRPPRRVSARRGRWWIVGARGRPRRAPGVARTLATSTPTALVLLGPPPPVWTTLLAVKVGLFSRLRRRVLRGALGEPASATGSAELPAFEPEDELVRATSRPSGPTPGGSTRTGRGAGPDRPPRGAIGQWQNWILFTHGKSFGAIDPQFHRNVGFFVFKLPFLNFVVNWALVSWS